MLCVCGLEAFVLCITLFVFGCGRFVWLFMLLGRIGVWCWMYYNSVAIFFYYFCVVCFNVYFVVHLCFGLLLCVCVLTWFLTIDCLFAVWFFAGVLLVRRWVLLLSWVCLFDWLACLFVCWLYESLFNSGWFWIVGCRFSVVLRFGLLWFAFGLLLRVVVLLDVVLLSFCCVLLIYCCD